MAWVRCCGGAPSSAFPWDAMAQTWTPQSPANNFSFPGGSYTATAVCNVQTPKINNNTITCQLRGSNSGWQCTGYLQVSIDGTNWTTIATANASAGYVNVSASLSAYNGNKLYLRCLLSTVNPNANSTYIAKDIMIS